MKKYLIITLMAMVATAPITGCGGGGNSAAPATGLQIKLTDAPGDFQHVNVTISEVSVVDDSDNIKVVNSNPQTFDLLALQNVDKVIGTADLPPGQYSQIRLKVKSASLVDNTGKTFDLKVPSGSQTGLKLVDSFVINANQLTSITLDFDAAQSIVRTGNVHSAPGVQYLLKPVIRVVAEVVSGQISGAVLDAATSKPIAATGNPVVTAYPAGAPADGSVPAAATSLVSVTDGSYSLTRLLPGGYDLYITADGYKPQTILNAQVTANTTTVEPAVALETGP